MKFNYRKIASILASAVMVSSTVGFAAAATYPAPFVSSGTADGAIVYGGNAQTTDIIASIDMQNNLNTFVTTSTSSTASASGESVDLATTSQKLYLNSSINAARTVITDAELPTILADGSIADLTGTTYDYTQSLVLGDSKIEFSKSGESIDPIPMVSIGTTAGDPLYNYTLTLVKALNVSDTTNVVGTATLKMQGVDYVVGANSDYNTLFLYGAGSAASVDEGETATVTVGGVEHEITLLGTSTTTSATIIVDGSQRTVTRGSSYKFAGDFEVYVKEVFHATKTGTLSNVDLLLGANTLHLESGSVIRQGAEDTQITKTKAYITGTINTGSITAITIQQAAEASKGDYLAAGDSYVDRVLGGVEFQFAGVVPAFDASTRETIEISTDNAVAARVTFTSGIAGATEKTITFAKDPDLVADSTLSVINLVNDDNKTIHVIEGANAKEDEWIIINAGDKGRIVEVGSIPTPDTGAEVILTDALTGEQFKFSVGVANTTSTNIDGNTYYLTTSGAEDGTVNVTWGTGASGGIPGTISLFPRIKLANGEWMSFLKQVTITNGTSYSVPGIDLIATYESALTLLSAADGGVTWHNTTTTATYTVGNVIYNMTSASTTTGTLDRVKIGSTDVVFNTTSGPAILILEEDTLADANGNVIGIPLTREGTTTVMPAIGSPVFSDGSSTSNTLDSDSSVSQGIDVYGTLVQRDTDDNNVVTIYYPNEQMTASVLVTEVGAVVTPGSSGGGGQIMVVEDSEVSSVSGKNLVVVGGSCVNTVAAKILDSDSPLCGADFTAKTNAGAGQYIIKTVTSPYNDNKIAMLVAGYEATDTVNAVARVKEGVSSDIGEMVYPELTA
jgi:hypothetical protein